MAAGVPTNRQFRQFRVGDDPEADFTKAEMEALIYKIADWYRNPKSGRNKADPLAEATKGIQDCLLAVNKDGNVWKNCPADFAARVKIKCNYDMVADQGIPALRNKNRGGGRNLTPGAKNGAKSVGASSIVASNFDQDAFRKKIEKDILTEFPELDNPAHLPNVRSLSMLYAQREIIDQELHLGVKAAARAQAYKDLKTLEEMADGLMKRLGIHPEQLRKRLNEKAASSIGDLVAAISDDKEYRQREKIWALQTALQLWWMTEHQNGSGTGPNMTPWECWHATRSRPVKFTCRHGETYTVVEGFEPYELKEILLANGVTKEDLEVPVLPGLYDAEDLQGLANYTPEQPHEQSQEYDEEKDDSQREGAAVTSGIQDY